MPTTLRIPVKRLRLDLSNYRTTTQKAELDAIEAIIAINPDWYWALTESLLADGYLPTENILILKGGTVSRSTLTVKEGNRRVSILKLIHGIIDRSSLNLPANIESQILFLSKDWKAANNAVPCVIYEPHEIKIVNRIRSLAHGKGEKAGRDKWTAVARARHNREENHASEPALDLLENYLRQGRNITDRQSKHWAGDFPLSVLEEAMKRLAGHVGASSSTNISKIYPNISYRNEFEALIHDIGQGQVKFEDLRSRDVGPEYGMTKPVSDPGKSSAVDTTKSAAKTNAATTSGKPATKTTTAVATNDPRQVARALKRFAPRGLNREKVVTLLDELRRLKIQTNPIAFCFLLRSLFEISAKVYCAEHRADGLKSTKADGADKTLVDMLKDVTGHLTKQNVDKQKMRELHGALTEMAKATGVLSVASLNQLVHNPKFSTQPADIAILFGNVFPLLEAMNS